MPASREFTSVNIILFSSAPNGVYYLKSSDDSGLYPVYCHMSSLSAQCGGGGWTLVMKLDRDKVKNVIINNIQVLYFLPIVLKLPGQAIRK